MSKIGLVLSGGMAKGAYEIGALRAIGKYLKPEDFTACSAASVGALNAYAYFGHDLESMADFWLNINKVSKHVNIYTALKSDLLQEDLAHLATLDPCVESFFVPLFKFSGRKLIYQNLRRVEKEKMHSFLNASVSCITPYRMDGELYFDGAAFDNIPVYPLIPVDLDYIICVYFDKYQFIFDSEDFDSKVIRIAFCDDGLLSSKTMILSHDTTLEMMKEGEKTAEAILSIAFANGMEPEAVLGQIEKLNQLNRTRKLRVTPEIIMGNINKLSSLIARRTKIK